ncbi:MAG: ABC transporter permease subunit [Lachnospiraceae bacterium]|nr:ABC transporter permease subunit [Lachnospiraceae bacterium]
MNHFGILVKYEWKKLLQKKLVRIAILVVILLQVFMNLSFLMQYYTSYRSDEDGNVIQTGGRSGYEKLMDDKEDAKALEGRKVDDAMLEEMRQFYAEYSPRDKYAEIHSMVRAMSGEESREFTGEELYGVWKDNIKTSFKSQLLSEKEIAYWEKKMENIETPFTYHYAMAWETILNNQCVGTGMLLVMLLAVCLSGIFAEESRLKTSNLILCAKNGKNPVYLAKAVVGMLFGFLGAFVLYVISFAFQFYFLGTEGFHAILQQDIVYSPYPITIGQAVLIMFGITVFIGVLESMFAMVLSLGLNNNLAAMSVVVGLMMLTFFIEIPKRFRILSWLWHFIPIGILGTGEFYDGRLFQFLGISITSLGFAPILYFVLSLVLFWVGRRKYGKVQTS